MYVGGHHDIVTLMLVILSLAGVYLLDYCPAS